MADRGVNEAVRGPAQAHGREACAQRGRAAGPSRGEPDGAAEAAALLGRARDLGPQLVAWRRHLHAHPELSFQETDTAAYLAAELEAGGLRVTRPMPNAVLAEIGGRSAGPVVALRADIDALPIPEETGLPFASRRPGVMHACGHDGHAAILLGASRLLAGQTGLPGRVRLLFQPGEEVPPGGAGELIARGALEGVAAICGLHLWSPLPVGAAVLTAGPAWAAADRFRAVLRGRAAHGAKPDEGVDALEAACRCVSALQSIVSRSVSPLAPAVVTVGRMQAGEAFNVIAGSAVLEGTVRAFDEGVRQVVRARVAAVLEHTAAAAGAELELEYVDGYPPLVNDPVVTAVVRGAAADCLGEGAVRSGPLEMAADDFARYLRHVPGCYLSLGATPAGSPGYPNHHPRFDIEESVLPVGAAILATAALRLLRRPA